MSNNFRMASGSNAMHALQTLAIQANKPILIEESPRGPPQLITWQVAVTFRGKTGRASAPLLKTAINEAAQSVLNTVQGQTHPPEPMQDLAYYREQAERLEEMMNSYRALLTDCAHKI